MARKSRKIYKQEQIIVKQPPQFLTALYLRLSSKEQAHSVSEAIKNQESFLLEFMKKHPELKLVSTFIDDGKTGTNFNRPGFNELMDEVRNGNINCIVVKDVSRLGRNFLETGNYIENVFPFLNVRFISVMDGFDTLTSSLTEFAYLIPLKNMMNENYARDISKKERTAKKILRKKGYFLGAYAIYGYEKSAEDKHKLVIDQEAAIHVKEIFELGEQGYSDSAIAKRLNEKKVACPAQYKYEKGILHSEKYSNTAGWYPQTVAMILKSRSYIGDMVQGAYCAEEMKGKRKSIPEEEWDIVPGQHEAIISREQFENVQDIRKRRRKQYVAMREENLQNDLNCRSENFLNGKVYCGDCHKSMSRKYIKSCQDKYRYICEVYERNGGCSKKYLSEQELIQALDMIIKSRIAMIEDVKSLLLRGEKRTNNILHQMDFKIEEFGRELSKLKQMKANLYQDFKIGILDKEEYLYMKDHYEKNINDMQKQKEQVQRERQEYILKYTEENPAIKTASGITIEEPLSRDLIDRLIDKIEIVEHHRIKIIFRFQDEYEEILKFVEKTEDVQSTREKVVREQEAV